MKKEIENKIIDNTSTIIRIDERTLNIQDKIKEFVTKTEFEPVKAIVYGLVTIILLAVIGALLTVIIK